MKYISKISKAVQRTLLGALSTFVLLLAGMGEARASHYAAADIDVQYIGPKAQQGFCGGVIAQYTYIVRLRIYKSCEPGSIDLSTTESYSVLSPSGCSPFTTTRSVTVKPENIDTLDQLCAQYKSQNACRTLNQGGPYPAFVRHTYIDTVTLPSACPDWTFSFTNGSRNGGINNLVNPGSNNIYVACMLNNAIKPTNSSPVLTTIPIPFICVGKNSLFLNGPTDVDNDSISIIPVAAKSGAGMPIAYLAPFTASNPVNSTAIPYTVDSRSGTASFEGPAQGKYVLAFRANEYDSLGNLLGYIERDVQVAVLPCQIAAPELDSIPSTISTATRIISLGKNNNSLNICPGTEIKFSLNGTSQSSGAVLLLSSNLSQSAPGANLAVQGALTSTVSGVFSWTPTRADVGNHSIIFTLTDSSCNANGQSILQRSYTVVSILVPDDVSAGPDGFYCPNPNAPPFVLKGYVPARGTFSWDVLPGGSPVSSLSQTDILNPEARPGFPTQYVITAQASPYICKLSDTVSVLTNNVKITQGPEVVLCRPGTLGLNAVATGIPPRQLLGCGTSERGICMNPDSVTIGNCTNTSDRDTATPFYTYYATQRSQMLYRREELRTAGFLSETIKRIAFNVSSLGSQAPMNNFKISMRCTSRTSLDSLGSVQQGFDDNTVLVYSGTGPVSLTPGWNYFTLDNDYNYDTSLNLLVDICFSNTANVYNYPASISYSLTPFKSFISKNFYQGNVCTNASTSYNPTTSIGRPNLRIFGCPPVDKPFVYKWTPGDFLVDSFGANTSAYVPQSIKYYISAEGFAGCTVRDSINIIVPTDTITVNPMDSLICPGELAVIEATKSPYERYQWYEGNFQPATTLDCDTCQRVLARPTVDTRYTVIGSITYGNLIRQACPDTAFSDVRVRMPAVIRVQPKDTTIKSGQRVILTVTGGDQYSWTPVSAGLNTNSGPRVVAQPQESTMFIVEGLDTNGCRGSDTSNVNIDYRQTLFVPTAFTPNNDGNNDVFGVVNLSVQKIIEFRVFNRWGQEIFSTTDPRQGWDGSWKATPQPTGNYNYIIRVAYPDGITDTFKGEVTLIR